MTGHSENTISKNVDEKALLKSFYEFRKKCLSFQNKYKTTLISLDAFEELQSKLTLNTTAQTEFRNSYSKWTVEDDLLLLNWYNNGKKIKLLCQDLGRTEGAIESRILKLRLDQFQFDFAGFVVDVAAELKISLRLFKSKVDVILDRRRYLFLKERIDNNGGINESK